MIVDLSSKRILATGIGHGKTHDLTLLRQSVLHPNGSNRQNEVCLAPNLCLMADSGYQGLEKDHAFTRIPHKKPRMKVLSPQQIAENRALAKQRILVEHVIRSLKIFRILSERYRNRRKRFGLRFNLLAAIYNMQVTK